ncbi:unnamed protein product, partial [Arabidopsis halleri]
FLSLFSLFNLLERKKLFRSDFTGGSSLVTFVPLDEAGFSSSCTARSAV